MLCLRFETYVLLNVCVFTYKWQWILLKLVFALHLLFFEVLLKYIVSIECARERELAFPFQQKKKKHTKFILWSVWRWLEGYTIYVYREHHHSIYTQRKKESTDYFPFLLIPSGYWNVTVVSISNNNFFLSQNKILF